MDLIAHVKNPTKSMSMKKSQELKRSIIASKDRKLYTIQDFLNGLNSGEIKGGLAAIYPITKGK